MKTVLTVARVIGGTVLILALELVVVLLIEGVKHWRELP
jgi:hypothetical protein